MRKHEYKWQLDGLEKQQDRKLRWTAAALKGKKVNLIISFWIVLLLTTGNFLTSQNTQTCSY